MPEKFMCPHQLFVGKSDHIYKLIGIANINSEAYICRSDTHICACKLKR